MGSTLLKSLALAALVLAMGLAQPAQAALSDFETGVYWSSANYDLYYAWYDPFKNTTPPAGETYPLLIYLHGSGNSGRDISGPASHPNASVLVNNAKNAASRAFVIIPQTHSGWNATGSAVKALREMIAEYAASHPIDTSRIYYTGFSLGGLGVFSITSNYPNEIAVGCPMAGALWESDNATKQANRASVAMWAFSGNIDGTVPWEDANEALEAQAAYGPAPMFTVYSSTGHNDTWQRVNELDQDGMISWMFAQQVGQPRNNSMFVGWPMNETEVKVLDGPSESMSFPLDFFVGYNGRGDLTIGNGATVTSRKGYISAQSSGRGNVVVDGAGSGWTMSGNLLVGDNNSQGSLHVANGAQVTASYVTVNQFSFISGNGTVNTTELKCEGEVHPGDVPQEATIVAPSTWGGWFVQPATSAVSLADFVPVTSAMGADRTGTLSASNGFRLLSKNTLFVDIDGANPGEYDAIAAGGTVYLAGELTIDMADGFDPVDGTEFVIAAGQSVSGTFSKINGLSQGDILLTPVYGTNTFSLVASHLIPGDLDYDGHVTIWDFTVFKYNYNKTGMTWSDGDFTGDGVVNIEDFILLKKNYNR